jgi:asparagine synthetase B (glutamine-hydrolysing)
MSGFFGMVQDDRQSVNERLRQESAEALRFRGPDGMSI